MVTVDKDKVTHNVDVCVCGSLIVSIFDFDVCILTFTFVTFDIFILDKGFGQTCALSFFSFFL